MDKLLPKRIPTIIRYVRSRQRYRKKQNPILPKEILAPEKTLAIGDSLGNIPSRSEDALLLLKRINAFESPINFESVEKSTDPSTPSLNDQIGTSKYTLIPNTTHYDAKEEAKNTLRRIMSYHKLDSPQKALKMLQDGTAGVLPRIELLNEILRAIVNSSEDVKDAEILMKNMYNTFGVKPNNQSNELLALGLLKQGQLEGAARIVSDAPVSEWSSTGEKVFNRALSDLILKGNSKKAWELFNRAWPRQLIRASDTAIECGRAPPPTVCATMINSLAREDRVEAGFKLHALMIADKQPATSVVHTSMIYLATRRKEYFPHALGFFQEMSVLGLEIKTPVYDHLLYGCAKNAALETGMQLWKAVLTDKKLKPSVYTCCNYLWVLASVETPENRLSIHRPFVYDSIQYDKLAQAADEVLSYAKDQGISINGHLSNALLSLHVNHWCREAAEHVFWGMICTDLPQHERTPFSHEIILKLYDQLRDYDGARRVYENYIENFVSPRDIYYLPSTEKTSDINSDKTVSDLRSTRKLSESMADFSLKSNLTVSERLQEQRAKRLLKTIPLPYEGWRALARTASLCNFHDEALLHVQEMRANGHSPHLDDFKMLLMRFSQASRPDLCEGLAKICDKNATFPNPFIPWRHRSRAIGALLNTAYGFRAPKSATNAIQEIKRDEKNPNPEPPVSAKIQSDIERLKRSLSQLHLSPPLRLC